MSRGPSAGASRLWAVLAVLAAAALLAAVASGEQRQWRPRLEDGSPVPALPAALARLPGRLVLTRVSVEPARRLRRELDSCARGEPIADRAPVVHRVGLIGESLTVRESDGGPLIACDDTRGPRFPPRRWCAGAARQLRGAHALDPRLTVLCRTRDGRPVGFLWIDPLPAARWIAVHTARYDEVYPVAAGLPVRVATTEGFVQRPEAIDVQITEYDRRARVLGRQTVEAQVAG